MLTTQQAEAAGMAWSTLSRMVKNGTLERVAHGVYRIRGAGGGGAPGAACGLAAAEPGGAGVGTGRRGRGRVASLRGRALRTGSSAGGCPRVHAAGKEAETWRTDVRLHRGSVEDGWISLRGMPVTRPHRIAADLRRKREDPGAVGQVIADALRPVFDYPGTVAEESRRLPRRTVCGVVTGWGCWVGCSN